MRLVLRVLVLAAFCLGLCVLPTAAQKITGDITGVVTDTSGGRVPNATVTAENPATRFTRTTKTSDAGVYRLPELPPGMYRLSVSAQGFKTTVRDAQVAVAQITDSDFTLQVGERIETVMVEASSPLVEFSNNLNNYVESERVLRLPLNGRDFSSLLGIIPGVQRAPGGGFLSININGTRRSANNWFIDGMYNNDRYYGDSAVGQTGVLGIPATTLPPEAIEEFTVQQLPSAEFGVKGGASINVSLRSGSNTLHGSAWEFAHWDQTDANNAITQQRTPLRNDQYGGRLGGPLVKGRTFYSVFFEGQRNRSVSPYALPVAAPADVAAARANAEMILGVAPGSPLPGDALASFFPTTASGPTDALGRLISPIPNTADLSEFGVKIDHQLGKDHHISGRYIFGDSLQSAPSAGYTLPAAPGNKLSLGPDAFNSVAPSRAQLLGVSWTYTISPNKILESRFGMTRFSQILDVNNKIDPKSLGIDTGPLDPIDFGVPYTYLYYVNSPGYIGGVGGYPISTRPDQTFDQSEHFTWTRGGHTMKIGGNWQYAFTQSLRSNARSRLFIQDDGSNTCSATSVVSRACNALTQLFLLRFDLAFRNFGDTNRHIYQHSMGLYWSDEWKVRPRLTLTFGLRYDLNAPLGESDKRGSNFDPVQGLVTLRGGLKHIYDYDFNNFGPRAGLAWDVFGNGKTALRIGYSLAYDVLNFGTLHAPRTTSFNRARVGATTNLSEGVFTKRVSSSGLASGSISAANRNSCFDETLNPAGDWLCGGPGNFIYGVNPLNPSSVPVFAVRKDLRTPYIHYFSVSIQHELFRDNVLTVSYVGSRGRSLTFFRDLNARPLGGGPRPFPSPFPSNPGVVFRNIIQLNNDGKSWYDSLQVSYRQRAWKGINTQYNFTWAHCIDYSSANRGQGGEFTPAMNPYNPAANRGRCLSDVRRNFNAGGTYNFPTISKLKRVGEGWQIGTVITVLDGRPFSASQGRTDASGQAVNGTLHPDCLAAPIYDTRNPGQYIVNTSDFTTAAPGTIGTCGRDAFVGPGLGQWDISLTKDTNITERVKFQFRWEVFNVTNRANFSQPNSDVRFGSFGKIFSTPDAFNPVISQGGPRNMQFVFKVSF